MELNTTQEQPIEQEIKELMQELKSNNLNGNEIIQTLKDENTELRESLESIRDDLLEMLTRGDNDKPNPVENTAV